MRTKRILVLCGITALIGCGPANTALLETADEPAVVKAVAFTGETADDEAKAKSGATKEESTDTKKSGETKKVEKPMPKFNDLTEKESYVILKKGTERAFTGEYWKPKIPGLISAVAATRHSIKALTNSKVNVAGRALMMKSKEPCVVKKMRMATESRSCARTAEVTSDTCFTGERFTKKNTRHCVNSLVDEVGSRRQGTACGD